jgi:hypothetical protein
MSIGIVRGNFRAWLQIRAAQTTDTSPLTQPQTQPASDRSQTKPAETKPRTTRRDRNTI